MAVTIVFAALHVQMILPRIRPVAGIVAELQRCVVELLMLAPGRGWHDVPRDAGWHRNDWCRARSSSRRAPETLCNVISVARATLLWPPTCRWSPPYSGAVPWLSASVIGSAAHAATRTRVLHATSSDLHLMHAVSGPEQQHRSPVAPCTLRPAAGNVPARWSNSQSVRFPYRRR